MAAIRTIPVSEGDVSPQAVPGAEPVQPTAPAPAKREKRTKSDYKPGQHSGKRAALIALSKGNNAQRPALLSGQHTMTTYDGKVVVCSEKLRTPEPNSARPSVAALWGNNALSRGEDEDHPFWDDPHFTTPDWHDGL